MVGDTKNMLKILIGIILSLIARITRLRFSLPKDQAILSSIQVNKIALRILTFPNSKAKINFSLDSTISYFFPLFDFPGLLKQLAGGDQITPGIKSQIAFIVAHEMAHILARHKNEAMSKVSLRLRICGL